MPPVYAAAQPATTSQSFLNPAEPQPHQFADLPESRERFSLGP